MGGDGVGGGAAAWLVWPSAGFEIKPETAWDMVFQVRGEKKAENGAGMGLPKTKRERLLGTAGGHSPALGGPSLAGQTKGTDAPGLRKVPGVPTPALGDLTAALGQRRRWKTAAEGRGRWGSGQGRRGGGTGRAGLLPRPGSSGQSGLNVSRVLYLPAERSREEASPELSGVPAGGRRSRNAGGDDTAAL